jgi:hypothetical protein
MPQILFKAQWMKGETEIFCFFVFCFGIISFFWCTFVAPIYLVIELIEGYEVVWQCCMILGVLLVWLTCDNGVVLLVAGHRTFALCLITSILENAVVGFKGRRQHRFWIKVRGHWTMWIGRQSGLTLWAQTLGLTLTLRYWYADL